jgi:shikimate dehydrogenase
MIYAEVIGDPIAQSKSPVIHKHWLRLLGMEGDYRKTRVPSGELGSFLSARFADANWAGCNVTIPHKVEIIPFLSEIDASAAHIGAVNCVERKITYLSDRLVGHNTDIDGVAAALDAAALEGRKATLIGAGGGARAVVSYLAKRGVDRIEILARNPGRAEPLRALTPEANLHVCDFDRSDMAFSGTAVIINASPLGMTGADAMPQSLLAAVRAHSTGATVFDMVTTPAETEFLTAGREGGGRTVDGLTMLVGQAARAFELFFGAPAPPPDAQLRDLLTTDSRDSG